MGKWGGVREEMVEMGSGNGEASDILHIFMV